MHPLFWRNVRVGAVTVAAVAAVGFAFLYVSNPCLRGDLDPGDGRGWARLEKRFADPPHRAMDGHVWIGLRQVEPVPPTLLIATAELEVVEVHWLLRTWQKLTGSGFAPDRLPDAPAAFLTRHVFNADFPMHRREEIADRTTRLAFRVCRRDATVTSIKRDGEIFIYALEAYAR